MKKGSVYSFSDYRLRETQAHGGLGLILTTRVDAGTQHPAFNFIDLTEIPADSSIGLHKHSNNDEEAYVVISGEGLMTIDGRQVYLKSGDVVINAPGGTHGLFNPGPEVLRIVVLDVPSRLSLTSARV